MSSRQTRSKRAEHDLNEAAESAGRVAEGERQAPVTMMMITAHDLGHRALDRLQDLLQRLLPGACSNQRHEAGVVAHPRSRTARMVATW